MGFVAKAVIAYPTRFFGFMVWNNPQPNNRFAHYSIAVAGLKKALYYRINWKRKAMKYHQFVDYTKLDPVKAAALEKFSETIEHPNRLGIRIVSETLGEPAVALDFLKSDFLLAFNVEGLGTKNKIADAMAQDERGKSFKYYEAIGQDTVARTLLP
jgi:hypothetical protein